MRDVTIPYRAPVQEERTANRFNFHIIATAFLFGSLIVTVPTVATLKNKVEVLEQDNAALHTCLSNLHIVMTRLDNPGPEHGVVVATVTCKGEGE